MSSQAIFNLVIGVAVAGLPICRQLLAWPVGGKQRLVVVLAAALGPGRRCHGCALGPRARGASRPSLGRRALQGPSGPGGATIVLYLAVTPGVQRLIVQLAAQRLGPATPRRVRSWSGLTSKTCVLGNEADGGLPMGLSAVGPVPVHVKFLDGASRVPRSSAS
jgi:hypothetical protein